MLSTAQRVAVAYTGELGRDLQVAVGVLWVTKEPVGHGGVGSGLCDGSAMCKANFEHASSVATGAGTAGQGGAEGGGLAGLPPAVAVALLVGFGWWPVFRELARWWGVDADYSHGYLVPLAALYFARRAWGTSGPPWQGHVTPTAAAAGYAVMGLGLAGHVAAWFAAVLLGDVLALIVLLAGMLLVVGGTRALKAYAFSVCFLIFMAPLPPEWYRPLAIGMQQVAAVCSTRMLELCGVPVYQQGNMIFLPDYRMEVGVACSGLRQILAFLALSVAAGEISGRRWGYRLTLAVLSLPTAALANCIRIVATGVIMMMAGKRWAEGVYHTLEGLATAALGLIILLAVAWGLARVEDWWRGPPGGGKP